MPLNRVSMSLSLIPSVIVTQLTLKLHQILDDEEAVFIPFTNLSDALDLAHELAKRNIGISLAVLSRKYLTEFISPTHEIAEDFNYIAEKYLKLNYIVDVICDKYQQKNRRGACRDHLWSFDDKKLDSWFIETCFHERQQPAKNDF